MTYHPETPEPDEKVATGYVWSKESCAAFGENATQTLPNGNTRLNIQRGLQAALSVDAPMLAALMIEHLIGYLSAHPDLSQRVLVLNPTEPDGKCNLLIDEDLIRYVLTNKLPPAFMVETGEGEITDD